MGNDSSGNGNDFAVSGLVATDQVLDTPTNNFCTFNPLVHGGHGSPTYKNGNLAVSGTNSEYACAAATFAVSTGKWYWEYYPQVMSSNDSKIGIKSVAALAKLGQYPNSDTVGTLFYNGYSGDKDIDNVSSAYGAAYVAGDIIGIALDLDSGTQTITFYKNNTSQGAITLSGGVAAATVVPMLIDLYSASIEYFNFGQDSSFGGNVTAQGNSDGNAKGDFYYSPPAGYLALCTDNLSDPSIALPAEHFNTLLWDGDDGASRTVSGVGFQPALFWLKARNIASNQRLQDSVRGDDGTRMYVINSNSTAAQSNDTSILSLTSDGFTTDDNAGAGGGNNSGENYVGWFWKASDTFDPTSAGTIAVASGKSNATAGFSIVKYTGENAVKTIGHGLATAPKLIIVKNLGILQWPTYYQRADGTDGVIWLDQDGDGEAAGTSYWNDTNPTASVFTVGDSANTGGLTTPDYIAYCFAEVEGYSKIGLYTGNGSADGRMIYTGFRPAYIMVKRTDADNDWRIFDNKRDPFNVNYHRLNANLNYAEGTEAWNYNDFVSNGFKWRVSDGGYNASGGLYLYIAFADYPFKTTNAR